ncbi:MAG: hypothetical protein H6599_07465 [Flavobacteriales bacterium]|nr:hypothetical protein [Flavobacteriales bacterium]
MIVVKILLFALIVIGSPLAFFLKKVVTGPEGIYVIYPYRIWSKEKGADFIPYEKISFLNIKRYSLIRRGWMKWKITNGRSGAAYVSESLCLESFSKILAERDFVIVDHLDVKLILQRAVDRNNC